MKFSDQAIKNIKKRILSINENISSNLLEEETEEIIQKRSKYENNFRQFCIDFMPYAGFSGEFYPDDAFEALVKYCESILKFEMKYALIAAPPRVLKTTIVSVLMPAYAWTYDPSLRFMSTCYAHKHAIRDNKQMARLIQSKPYQRLWGKKFHIITENKIETVNNKGGKRVAVSLLGQALGEGADIILIDDPNSIRDINSITMRERTFSTFENTFIHRRNNPKRSVIVICMQRLHHEDFLGHVESKKDKNSTLLELIMEYEEDRHCTVISPTTGKIIWDDKRNKKGEILCPDRFDKEILMDYKKNMGTNLYNCLFQASPSSDETSIFKHDWFQIWNKPYLPEIEFTIQAWDTAISTGVEACYSAGITFGLFYDDKNNANLILLSLFVGKLEFNELLNQMIRMSKDFFDTDPENPRNNGNAPDFILVEGHANGVSLKQELNRRRIDVIQYNPPKSSSRKGVTSEDSKVVRARKLQPLVENKHIFLRAAPFQSDPNEYGKVFRTACKNFPSQKNGTKDIVDTFTMVVDFLREQNMVKESSDIDEDKNEKWDEYIPPKWHWNPTATDKYRSLIK